MQSFWTNSVREAVSQFCNTRNNKKKIYILSPLPDALLDDPAICPRLPQHKTSGCSQYDRDKKHQCLPSFFMDDGRWCGETWQTKQGKWGSCMQVWADDLAPSARWHSAYLIWMTGDIFWCCSQRARGVLLSIQDAMKVRLTAKSMTADENNDAVWKQSLSFICIMHVCMHMYACVCPSGAESQPGSILRLSIVTHQYHDVGEAFRVGLCSHTLVHAQAHNTSAAPTLVLWGHSSETQLQGLCIARYWCRSPN